VIVDSLTVLDLTDDDICSQLGVTSADLIGNDYGRTQAVGEAAAKAGFDAILAPSAALPGRLTLVVFPAGMSHLTASPSRVRQPPPRLGNLLRSIPPHPQVPGAVRDHLRSVMRTGTEAVRRSP
jgi:RES domain-containing protein